jgi:hypothetical protein
MEDLMSNTTYFIIFDELGGFDGVMNLLSEVDVSVSFTTQEDLDGILEQLYAMQKGWA